MCIETRGYTQPEGRKLMRFCSRCGTKDQKQLLKLFREFQKSKQWLAAN